jgi:hypothetical protein
MLLDGAEAILCGRELIRAVSLGCLNHDDQPAGAWRRAGGPQATSRGIPSAQSGTPTSLQPAGVREHAAAMGSRRNATNTV